MSLGHGGVPAALTASSARLFRKGGDPGLWPPRGQGPSTEPGNAHRITEVMGAAVAGVGSPSAVWVSGLAGAGAGTGHPGAVVEAELRRGGQASGPAPRRPAPSSAAPASVHLTLPFLPLPVLP